MVGLTAAEQCNDCDLLGSAYRDISAACQEQGVALAISFGRKRPDGVDQGHWCNSFVDLKNNLRAVEQDMETVSVN